MNNKIENILKTLDINPSEYNVIEEYIERLGINVITLDSKEEPPKDFDTTILIWNPIRYSVFENPKDGSIVVIDVVNRKVIYI